LHMELLMKIFKIIFDWFLLCLPRWGKASKPNAGTNQCENTTEVSPTEQKVLFPDPGVIIHADLTWPSDAGGGES